MKKNLAMLLVALLILCMVSCSKDDQGDGDQDDAGTTAGDNATAYGDFLYDVNQDGNYKITGYTYTGVEKREVTIPATIADRPVTAIDNDAFKSLHNICAVTIPDSVVTIGAHAFYDCDFLTEITIPSSVTLIGAGAFENCSALATVTFNKGLLEIETAAFKECAALTTVVLPDGLLTLGGGAFLQCTSLTAATVPHTVIEVGDAAFYGCASSLVVTFEEDSLIAMNAALSAYIATAGNSAPETFAAVMEILTAANVDTEGLAENGGYQYTWDRETNSIVKTDDAVLNKMNAVLAAYQEEHGTLMSLKEAQEVLEAAGYYFGGVSDNGVKYVWDKNENVLYGALNADDMTLLTKINAALKANVPGSFDEIELIVKNAELDLSALNVSVSSGKFFWNSENSGGMTNRYIGEALQTF